ncbi:MAG: LEA/WHy family protein [Steroidobacteraceae bacterium]
MGPPDRILKTTVAAACLLWLGACSLVTPKFNRPNVSVMSIEMRSGNLLQQNFAVKLNIQNPNNQALPVKGLHVELNVGGAEIASGVSDRAVVVPAFGESEFDLTIRANMALAVIQLADKINQHSDTVDYDLTGAASIDLPFLRDLPFHQTGSFSLKGAQ